MTTLQDTNFDDYLYAWVADMSGSAATQEVQIDEQYGSINDVIFEQATIGGEQVLVMSFSVGFTGFCTKYSHNIVYADGTRQHIGQSCGRCYTHDDSYSWIFLPNDVKGGGNPVSAIVRTGDTDMSSAVYLSAPTTSMNTGWCDYNVHFDEASQFAAYMEYTDPLSVHVEKLESVTTQKSEFAVSGVTFSQFGGMDKDGSYVLAASNDSVYAADVNGGVVESATATLLSPVLGDETVKKLTKSPNDLFAAYVGYFDDFSNPDNRTGNVYLADMTTMSHEKDCFNPVSFPGQWPSQYFLQFSPDSSILFFSTTTTDYMYDYLFVVDLINGQSSKQIASLGGSSPQLWF
jgi:hypothetical protein